MKKLLLLLLYKLIPVIVFSQAHLDIGIGYNNKDKGIFNLGAGYIYKGIVLDAEIRPKIPSSDDAINHNYRGFALGYNILHQYKNYTDYSVIPTVEYEYIKGSAVKEHQQHWFTGYSIKISKNIKANNSIFVDVTYINSSMQAVIGMHVIID